MDIFIRRVNSILEVALSAKASSAVHFGQIKQTIGNDIKINVLDCSGAQSISKIDDDQDLDDDALFDEFDRMFEAEDEICRRIYALKVQHGNREVEMALGSTRRLPYLEQPAAMHQVLNGFYSR